MVDNYVLILVAMIVLHVRNIARLCISATICMRGC